MIAAFRRDSTRSSEAGLKYFVLGALSSGMLLYGASMIYGFTGETSFEELAVRFTGPDPEPGIGVIVGLVFPAGGARLQDFRRAVPHVDARRLRRRSDSGDGLLRGRAEDRRGGAF